MNIKNLISTGLLVIILLAIFNLINWDLFIQSIMNINPIYLAIGVIMSLFCPLINAERWRNVLKAFEIIISFKRSFNSVMISFSANLFAPAKAGDFIKVFLLKDVKNKSLLTSAVAAERVGDLLILALLALIVGILTKLYLSIIIGGALLISILFFLFLISKLEIKFKNPILFKIWNIIKNTGKVWRNKFLILRYSLFYSFINWFLISIQVWILFMAINVNINLFTVMCLFPLTVLLSIIPLTPGNVGVREASYIFLFAPYASSHDNMIVAMLYYLTTVGLTAVLGFIFINMFLQENFNQFKNNLKNESKS